MLYDEMQEYIEKNMLCRPSEKVGVAVSGGADSVALLICLKKLGYPLTVLHVEHGIRGEQSVSDMHFVEDLCKRLGVPIKILRADVPASREKGESIESAARRIRYSFFEEVSRELDLKHIAIAHHIEDASESFMLNLLRGSGLKGLSGMRPKRTPNIIRPLLFATREQIEAFLEEEGEPFVTDATNEDEDYTRNYLRKNILPLMRKVNPSCDETLLRTADIIAEEDAALEEIACKKFGELAQIKEDCVLVFADELSKESRAVARRILRIAVGKVCGLKDIEQGYIEALLSLCTEGKTGRAYEVKGRFFARLSYNQLKISPKKDIIKKYGETELNINEDTFFEGHVVRCEEAKCLEKVSPQSLSQTVNADALEGAVIRTRRSGDVFTPFGGGQRKLKDYFIDIKLPRDEREKILLIAKENEVLWVVGKAISEKLRVDEKTGRIIKITCFKKDI